MLKPIRVVGVALLAMAACDTSVGPDAERGVATRIELAPREIELLIGDTAWVTAVAYDAWGDRISGPHVRYGIERPGPRVDWRLTKHMVALTRSSDRFQDPETAEFVHGLQDYEAGTRVWGMGVGETWLVAESGEAADSIRVSVRGNIVSLAGVTVGSAKACGLSAGGRLYCWGAIETQYAEGRIYPQPAWAPVPLAGNLRFSQVTIGGDHTCGLTLEGNVYCWGRGGYLGTLGHGGRFSTVEPKPLAGGLRFREIASGGSHNCGITLAGALYCWGLNAYGELGVGHTAGPDECVRFPCSLLPIRVNTDLSFEHVAANGRSTCALSTEGRTYCWGSNNESQLGHESAELCDDVWPCTRMPREVTNAPELVELAAGVQHFCGRTADGQVFCWGHNGQGELGTGDRQNSRVPVPLSGGLRFVKITQSCGLTIDGRAYCWGPAGWSQGGAEGRDMCGANPCNLTPVPVSGGLRFTSISSGRLAGCGMTDEGPFCWGRGPTLGVGNPDIAETMIPLPVYQGTDAVPGPTRPEP